MERMMAMGPDGERIKADRVLELNPKHRVFDVLKQAQKDGDTAKIELYSTILYDQALIVENMPIEDPVAYAQAVTSLME
jgi:molecular chaperone HtpG